MTISPKFLADPSDYVERMNRLPLHELQAEIARVRAQFQNQSK